MNAFPPHDTNDGASAIPPVRLAVLYAVVLVSAAGNTAMQSILPAIGSKLNIPDVWVSMAFSWSALLWVLTAPYWARQSDRRGRRQLMGVGVIGFALSMVSCGLVLWAGLNHWISAVATFVAFAVFRSLYGGLGSAAPPAVQAYVAARTERANRTRALSLISSSFGLGTVIGPAMAPFLILPLFGLAGPMLSFAVIGLGVLIALRLYLPDDTPRFAVRGVVAPYPGQSTVAANADSGDDDDIGDPLENEPLPARSRLRWTDPRLRPWFTAGLIGGHAQAMATAIIGFLILDRLHLRATPELGTEPTGMVLMAGAFATLLAQWAIIPSLNLQPRRAIVAGSATATVGLLILAYAGSLLGIGIAFAIISLGFGLYRPGFTAGASLAVPRHEQGAVAGMTASINGAAYIAAPVLGVGLYSVAEHGIFIAIAALCLCLALWARRRIATDDAPRAS